MRRTVALSRTVSAALNISLSQHLLGSIARAADHVNQDISRHAINAAFGNAAALGLILICEGDEVRTQDVDAEGLAGHLEALDHPGQDVVFDCDVVFETWEESLFKTRLIRNGVHEISLVVMGMGAIRYVLEAAPAALRSPQLGYLRCLLR